MKKGKTVRRMADQKQKERLFGGLLLLGVLLAAIFILCQETRLWVKPGEPTLLSLPTWSNGKEVIIEEKELKRLRQELQKSKQSRILENPADAPWTQDSATQQPG